MNTILKLHQLLSTIIILKKSHVKKTCSRTIYMYTCIMISVPKACYIFLYFSIWIGHCTVNVLLLLFLKEVGSARPGESYLHPISLKAPAPQYQPTDKKEEKGKSSRRQKGIEQDPQWERTAQTTSVRLMYCVNGYCAVRGPCRRKLDFHLFLNCV